MSGNPVMTNANPWLPRVARIVEVVREIEGVATYRLELVDPPGDPLQLPLGKGERNEYQFAPGQFNMLYLPGAGEVAISFSGDPQQTGGWRHTVRQAGNVTHALARLTPGDQLGVRGPFGAPWPLDELVARDVIIVAGGLGLAPLRPLVYELLRRRGEFGRIWLIVGARTPEGLLYRGELEVWRQRGIDVQVTVDRATPDWTGHVGVVTLLTDRLRLPDPARACLLACGPEVMMKFAAASAHRLGISDERIWVSLERNMQCAVGFCGHCQLGPEFVCKDGPVFRYDRVRRLLAVESL